MQTTDIDSKIDKFSGYPKSFKSIQNQKKKMSKIKYFPSCENRRKKKIIIRNTHNKKYFVYNRMVQDKSE